METKYFSVIAVFFAVTLAILIAPSECTFLAGELVPEAHVTPQESTRLNAAPVTKAKIRGGRYFHGGYPMGGGFGGSAASASASASASSGGMGYGGYPIMYGK
ncbi:unnamed protein product [Orchesella dallaii]|uniref:Uncharacterized protein n=1 Tax=Orchesella dallaii TaxID=48710 RepID=A0ABP1RY66_9HEXA